MSSVFILGIAGGSCSGKTTLTQYVKEAFGEKANVLAQDNFILTRAIDLIGMGEVLTLTIPVVLIFLSWVNV